MGLIGAQIETIDRGSVDIALAYREDLTQQGGTVHAGVITSILDSACGYAALSMMPPDSEVLSVEFKVNLLRPARAGRFVAEGRVLKAGRTLTVVRGDATLVAARGNEVLGFVTVHVTPVLHRPAPVGRMTALVVASRARNQGLGRALVAGAEQHLQNAGCGIVEVTSHQNLTQARSFYERLGYSRTSYRFGKTLPPERAC